MHYIKKEIYDNGYSSQLSLESEELNSLREFVEIHWLKVISEFNPTMLESAEKYGIQNYHLISSNFNHSKTWTKTNRLFNTECIQKIKCMKTFSVLENIFGKFKISDVYETEQRFGVEEMYWRLVRPNQPEDVGPLHADYWFHQTFNGGEGMFKNTEETFKVWIPIFSEPGKNGLGIVKGSNSANFPYEIKVINHVPKPVPTFDEKLAKVELIPTLPGNILIFHERTLHKGFTNLGQKTRVSMEVTLVTEKN
ncbi:MAG: hypothetical protein CBC42_05275 [Betaproteobacteria bacterium TMED82]|nr:MAG: hypothetical protein CBC42_05275 [Betaproteobacteria bacterium TMED82]|tara:strand:+ start:115274 stop:116029 length:756 start_codon:yes stop_codon:yes gene_type:complete